MQFSLQTLMLAFVVVAAAVGLCGLWGLLLAAVILGIAGYIRMAKDRYLAWAKVILILFFCLCSGIFLPLFCESREPGRRANCISNQKNIALALVNYADEHGHFPPAYIADSNGKPMHSWRVLILPYLDRNDLYKAYNFSEPWNGPNNSKLAKAVPSIYSCPACSKNSQTGITNYVAVVGPKTVWQGEKSSSIKEIAAADGTSETILFMEQPNSDINWLEPRDLSYEEIFDKMTPEKRAELFNAHNGTSVVSFADAHQNVLSDRFLEKNLSAMLTWNGGEKIDFENDPGPGFRAESLVAPEWRIPISLLILIGTAILIIYRPLPKKDDKPVEKTEEKICSTDGNA